MTNASTTVNAATAGSLDLGGDLSVNRMGFGAMRLTGDGIWGEPRNHDEAIAVLRRAIELGVNFIDTADAYGPAVSEDLIAEALYPYPRGLVVATKGGLVRGGPNKWDPIGRPEYLRAALEMSLRRLKLERIDLYQFHRPDPRVPFEESVSALVDLRKEGKIAHIGLSNVTADQLATAQKLASIASVQNRFNVTDRDNEDVIAACEQTGIAFIPWAPLGSGPLTRPGGPLDTIARAHNATQGQVALAWLLHRSPRMLVIPGTSRVAHLEENVSAAALQLTQEELASLNG